MLEYATNRDLMDKSGKIKGKIRIIKFKEDPFATVEYTCPNCGFHEKVKMPWKKPFSFHCKKCNFLIRVPSLRYEIKKAKKKKLPK